MGDGEEILRQQRGRSGLSGTGVSSDRHLRNGQRLNLRLTDHGTGSCFEIPTAADVNFQFFLFLSLCNTQTLSFPVTRSRSLSLSLRVN